jgi:hypothetical protein
MAAGGDGTPNALGGPLDLVLQPLGGPARHIGRIGSSGLQPGGPVILACDMASDRAIVGDDSLGRTEHATVMTLSSGATRSLTFERSSDIRATSSDGHVIAVVQDSGDTALYDANTGGAVRTVKGRVRTLSGDGRLALVTDGARGFWVIDGASGRLLWTAPAGARNVQAEVQRGYSAMLVQFTTEAQTLPEPRGVLTWVTLAGASDVGTGVPFFGGIGSPP